MSVSRSSTRTPGVTPGVRAFTAPETALLLALSLTALTAGPVCAAGMAADSSRAALVEDGYIEQMDEYLSVKLKLDSDTRWFRLDTAGDDYDIRPNSRLGIRASLHYRFISFSYGSYPGFIPGNNDDDLKGNTEARSYALRLDLGHWIQDLSYSRVDGFYLDNTSDFRPGWVEGRDSYILFPDLLYRGYRGITAYKINSRFSFKALSSQTERQRKSAGSLMPLISYNYYRIDDRTWLTGENSSQRSDNLELFFSLSYFHTLVLSENFYLSAGIAPGAGMIYTKLLTRMPEGEFTDRYDHPIYRLELQGALGYSARRFFAGAQVIAAWNRYEQDAGSAVVINEKISYQVFAGYRFDAPGFLSRLTDSVTGIF